MSYWTVLPIYYESRSITYYDCDSKVKVISVLLIEYMSDDVTIRLVLIAFHNSSR